MYMYVCSCIYYQIFRKPSNRIAILLDFAPNSTNKDQSGFFWKTANICWKIAQHLLTLFADFWSKSRISIIDFQKSANKHFLRLLRQTAIKSLWQKSKMAVNNGVDLCNQKQIPRLSFCNLVNTMLLHTCVPTV